jgi:starch-binding outer membrane protein, SusD/RagB family
MKKIIFLFAIATLFSCSDFLDVTPKGVLSDAQVSSPDKVDNTVNAAYASLGNDHYITPFSLWPYGNVRSGDAYKGGRDEGDIQAFYFMETFKNVKSDFGEMDALWFQYYVGISRANSALKTLNTLTEANFPKLKIRQAECRFIRAHYYFQLKELWKYVPFIDETIAIADYPSISNRALTNDQMWDKIADDFKFGVDNLPAIQTEIGRANKAAATAYLAKTRLFQAYEQDDRNNVTTINATKLQQVVDLINTIPATYGLVGDYADLFTPGATENGNESLFAIQFSDKGDGTTFGRLNFGDVLATPMGIGCCDFHKPSKNLANAFKTDPTTGLPMFDTYDAVPLDLSTDKVDPRLNHTIAIPGHPWKYDPTTIYQESWNRTPDVYGVYASLKENVCKTCYTQVGPFYGNTKNRMILRFADVLLMKAEALIELGGGANLETARQIINQIRTRAANSTAHLKMADNSFESKFNVGTYGLAGWDQSYARKALRWERRLELAMEGNRFFDLVRWGIADTYMNGYFASEKTKIAYLKNGLFTKNRDEYLPIPDNQMRFSKGVYIQNAGY